MGWSSWYAFKDDFSDAVVRQQADAMLANGMHQAGYEYVNIDDGWEGDRDSQGNLQPNANFPDMKALGAYLHSRGFKFGLYTTIGQRTCTGHLGSYGHEEQDAQMFLDWDVDFVKYDLCEFPPDPDPVIWPFIRRMSTALRSQETHPIVLSIVMLDKPWIFAPSLAVNMWRIRLDIEDTYESMMSIADFDAGLGSYAGKTGWNDPDLLQVGRGGMTTDEYRTHMTLWAMLAAPLIASTDLLAISPTDLEILTNPDVIAINQDSEARQGKRVAHGLVDVWVKKLNPGWAIAVVNRRRQTTAYLLNARQLGIKAQSVYEVWTKQTLAVPRLFTLPGHGCVLLRTQ